MKDTLSAEDERGLVPFDLGTVEHAYNLPFDLVCRIVLSECENRQSGVRGDQNRLFGWVRNTRDRTVDDCDHPCLQVCFDFSPACFRSKFDATERIRRIANPPCGVWWSDDQHTGVASIFVHAVAPNRSRILCIPFQGERGSLRREDPRGLEAHIPATDEQLKQWLAARDSVSGLHFAIVDRELRRAEQALKTLPPAPGSQLLQVQYDELATLLARAPSMQQTKHTTWPAGEERMRYTQGGCIRLYLAASKRGDKSEIEMRHEIDANCAAPGMDDVADLELRQWFDAVRADIAEKYPEAFGPAPMTSSVNFNATTSETQVYAMPGETLYQKIASDLRVKKYWEISRLWLVEDLTAKQIGERVRLSAATVHNYLSDLYELYPEAKKK